MQMSRTSRYITGNTNLKLLLKVLLIGITTIVVPYNVFYFINSPSTYYRDLGEALSLID